MEKNKKQKLITNWTTRLQPINKRDRTQLIIENLPSPQQDEGNYLITYVMEILPSGHFSFNHHDTNLFGFTPLISFDLGKDYKCYKACIENFNFIEPHYLNTDKEIRLKLERTDNNFHRFILSGIEDIRVEQGVYLSLSISLFISFLILLKDLIEELYYKRKRKK